MDGMTLSENPPITKKAATIIIMRKRIGVEIDRKETYSAPIMLKRTGSNRIADLRIASLESARLLLHELRPSNRSRLYPTKERDNVKTLSAISSGIVDKGREMPTAKNNSLMKKLTNIKKAILRPTEKHTVSTILVSFNFRNLRRMKPGTNVR